MIRVSEIYHLSQSLFSPPDHNLNQSWDYGRKHALPLWLEFVCIARYGKESKFIHYCPTNTAVEIPLDGDLSVTLNGKSITVFPGEFLILPAGEENSLTSGPSGFCRKISCGLCGSLVVQILSMLRLSPGKKYILAEKEMILSILKEMERFLFRKEKKSVPEICGLSFSLLMHLAASVPDVFNPLIADAIRIMEFKGAQCITVGQLCEELNVAPEKLTRLFKQQTGFAPKQYLISLRMKNAESLLQSSPKSIKEIAFLTGYSSPQKFCKEFRKFHRMTPGQFRQRFSSSGIT